MAASKPSPAEPFTLDPQALERIRTLAAAVERGEADIRAVRMVDGDPDILAAQVGEARGALAQLRVEHAAGFPHATADALAAAEAAAADANHALEAWRLTQEGRERAERAARERLGDAVSTLGREFREVVEPLRVTAEQRLRTLAAEIVGLDLLAKVSTLSWSPEARETPVVPSLNGTDLCNATKPSNDAQALAGVLLPLLAVWRAGLHEAAR